MNKSINGDRIKPTVPGIGLVGGDKEKKKSRTGTTGWMMGSQGGWAGLRNN